MEAQAETEDVICSAKGCREPAAWSLHWRNPRIHTGAREKTWVACDEHRPSLAEFLDRRSFLLRVEVFSAGDGQARPSTW